MADMIFKMGSINNSVKGIQARLNKWYREAKIEVNDLVTDGIFGTKTEERVKDFQQRNGLKADGIIGPITWDVLFPVAAWQPAKRHVIYPYSQGERVNRALGLVNAAPVKYHLEYPNGGTNPVAPTFVDEETNQGDCAALVAWVNGYDRDFLDGMSKTFDGYGGWCNTNSMTSEAREEGLLFTLIAEWDDHKGWVVAEGQEIRPGDTIASPSDNKVGHTGIVTFVGNLKRDGLDALHVVHCSPSNYKKSPTKSAVFKTTARVWDSFKRVYIVRFNTEYAYKRWLELTGAKTE